MPRRIKTKEGQRARENDRKEISEENQNPIIRNYVQ